MAAGDITNENQLSILGVDIWSGEVVVNGTTAVEVQTKMRKIFGAVLTFAEAPATGDDSVLFYTKSGGVLSVDCNAACGTKKVFCVVFGLRG